MGNLTDFAKQELDRIGMTDNDRTGEDMNFCMRDHILRMIEEFEKEGHSGFSASYALSVLKRLLEFKPLTPLTGEADEWMDVYEDDKGRTVYQNVRLSTVFKNGEDGEAYDIDGKVFWEWFTDPDTGEKSKVYFTSKESATPVEFPYTQPDEPIYEFRPTEEDKHAEPENDPANTPTPLNTVQEVEANT